jgi:hypothetical protein
MISKPIEVKALENYYLWIRFEDGVEGTLDLSSLIAKEIFNILRNPIIFATVYIDTYSHAVAWNSELEICPDTIYLKLRNITFNEWFETNKN